MPGKRREPADHRQRVDGSAEKVQTARVKTSLVLDPTLEEQLAAAVKCVGEKDATVLRMAVRAGLPLVVSRHQAPRPEGYFASDYESPRPEQVRLEKAMGQVRQKPERAA